ncbi:MAG: Xaa-Pro dipeptidase, partial [Pseudomonadota bacterium]
LLIPGRKPQLFLPRPADYWHSVPPDPEYLADVIDVQTFSTQERLLKACESACNQVSRLAEVGPVEGNTNAGRNEHQVINPTALLDYIDFHRARKTGYELMLMREASDIGARGHLAAAEAFAAGGSEFAVHMAYLLASAQNEQELPYGNIVGINEHAGILHYQHQDRTPAKPSRSLLIDAGGSRRGYASDITRTYAHADEQESLFATLIKAMEAHQQQLIEQIRPGDTYADLHDRMHQQLATILAEHHLVKCGADAAYTSGLTRTFCPHGLGHLLGLQVHDAGGHLADSAGTPAPPPEAYPALRFTRAIEIDQVFTIEPGLYFMPQLLEPLRQSDTPVNWAVVDPLIAYGGIRIEDNVRVLAKGCENLTRDAFARVSTAS